MDVEIPDKLYFKIGEVAELAGVKPHVLRYWESEFGSFRPVKSKTNQRLYKRKDIEFVLQLKDLLHNQGFTISGARKKMRELARAGNKVETAPQADRDEVSENQMALPLVSGFDSNLLDEIRNDLQSLRDSLKKDPPKTSE
jgi:DNA-binding transcriptional MerR regulator